MGMSFSLIIILSDLIVHPERCMVPQKDTMLLNTTRRVLPLAGHRRFMRLSSDVHRKQRLVLWSDGGYPCCPDAGVGDPPS